MAEPAAAGEDGRDLVGGPAADDDAGPWSRLVRSFLHEARSPLNALGIYLELLSTKVAGVAVPPGTRPEAAPGRLVERAGEQVHRIEELLRLFADLAAPRRGEVVDLGALAVAAGRFAAHEAVRKGHRLECEAAPGFPIDADVVRVADALVRLAAAMMCAPEGSALSLRVAEAPSGPYVEAGVVPPPGGELPEALLEPGVRALEQAGATVLALPSGLRAQFHRGRGV